MKIKVTIKAGSKAADTVKKQVAEKKAFREAVKNGNVSKYAKENPTYFSIPS